jgi:PadR family transcriptional regulator, regulatory protein PadR
MDDLKRVEEMVLWAVWKLRDNAYGVTIRKQLSEATGRIFPYGTLYSTLDTLFRREYVLRRAGDPLPIRGGRGKIFYRITPKGIAALKSALELNKALWNEKSELALNRS